MYRVLIRVDLQLDFMPGGSLAVPNGDEVVPLANRLAQSGFYNRVIDTMDDHPPDHGSFASQYPGKKPFDRVVLNGIEQVLWPDHCVHGTNGWRFHRDVDRSITDATFQKGQDKRVDSYSGFYDNGRHVGEEVRRLHPFLGRSTGLAEYLKSEAAGFDAAQIDIIGLALGYCVSFTAIDAAEERFTNVKSKYRPYSVRVIDDAVKAIAKTDDEVEQQLEQLRRHGITIISSEHVLLAG